VLKPHKPLQELAALHQLHVAKGEVSLLDQQSLYNGAVSLLLAQEVLPRAAADHAIPTPLKVFHVLSKPSQSSCVLAVAQLFSVPLLAATTSLVSARAVPPPRLHHFVRLKSIEKLH
jgi:hypothetical protein